MKFRFDTTQGFGHITHEDFIHHPIEFFPEPSQLEQALEMGLLPDEANPETPEPWFAARSTRIVVADYEPTKTVKRLAKKIKSFVIYPEQISQYQHELIELFEAYCNIKGFDKPYDLSNLILNNLSSKRIIGYQYIDGSDIIGYVIQRRIGKVFLSLQFVWDYVNPRLSLGTVSQYFEVQWAKALDGEYVYLMPAYEKSCLYKADFKGIEWFTGKEWSRDTEQLKELCRRDEQFIVTELPFQS